MRKGSVTNKAASNRVDIVGKRFDRLVVTGEPVSKNWVLFYPCRCDCGNDTLVRSQLLRERRTKSCGCLGNERRGDHARRHGMSRTPIHNAWMSMINRCEDPKTRAYKDYGARGIAVCERWHTFENFLADMGIPENGMTLERRENDLGYSKENCVWATKTAQANNRRSSKIIEFGGESLTQAEWERKQGLRTGQLYERLKKGWSVERAIMTPRGTPGGIRPNSGRKPTK